jgi:hypothetical protein
MASESIDAHLMGIEAADPVGGGSSAIGAERDQPPKKEDLNKSIQLAEWGYAFALHAIQGMLNGSLAEA